MEVMKVGTSSARPRQVLGQTRVFRVQNKSQLTQPGLTSCTCIYPNQIAALTQIGKLILSGDHLAELDRKFLGQQDYDLSNQKLKIGPDQNVKLVLYQKCCRENEKTNCTLEGKLEDHTASLLRTCSVRTRLFRTRG